MNTPTRRAEVGRPPATSRAELERIAFELFARDGFADTSVDDIAAAAGIARRTFFRYFASKADLVWGDFPGLLTAMRIRLRECPQSTPVMQALHAAAVEFNSVPRAEAAAHRQRMTLILTTPALLANSTLRFTEWRAAVAEFVARRLGCWPNDLLPVVIGYSALGASLAAYEQWLTTPGSELGDLMHESFGALSKGWAEL
jgi:TetR/AcrR family transcriptional regulator, regulator of mycofactocin system